MARPSTTARGLLVGGVEIENARQSAYSRQFDNIEWPAAWPHTAADLTPEDRNRLKEHVREAILAGFDPELQDGPAAAPPRPPGSPARPA